MFRSYKKGRPVLKIPRSRLEVILEVLAILGILFHVLLLVYYWPALPETIPTHFGFSGEADSWGGKSSLILLLVVNIGMYLMFTVFHYLPHIYNYNTEITEKNAWEQYYNARLMLNVMKVEIVWVFAYIGWGTVQTGLGKAAGLDGRIMAVILIVIFVTMFYFMWRERGIG
ncbi:MAG TPA: hypothetical protein DDY25_06680 [Peptococcaceae bacterium]|jgi:uncharacterized membrane protein|nr:hypothetical protein [Peptococcaceae bacterium]